MPPQSAVHLLGLCNIVAGALVALAPAVFLSGVGGLESASARLLGHSLGLLLAAVGTIGWLMPPEARSLYLWSFGVVVKILAALLWGGAALADGMTMVAAGAVTDVAVALAIAGILIGPR